MDVPFPGQRRFTQRSGHVSSSTTLNVYAHSEEECEQLLAELIAGMKAEIRMEKERLKAGPKAG